MSKIELPMYTVGILDELWVVCFVVIEFLTTAPAYKSV
jgi:hypothetical protein